MTPVLTHLTNLWNEMFPALADHLWQSTLFVLAAGLLTLILRKHSARVRYTLWLAASLKFLVPCSLLVAVGSWLSPAHTPTAGPGMYLVEEMSQPFTQPFSAMHAATIKATEAAPLFHWQALLLVLWVCGAFAVLLIWVARWRKVSAARRSARPLSEGREVSALHRLIGGAPITPRLQFLLSTASHEPGVFGIFHPVLLWPSSISEHLDDSHLEAVLAHELCHIRRQDNLAAFFHMIIECVFWFHPLVWWLGARLIEERERACDEAVIEIGSGRQVYAESILKICEFCLRSPLTCVSGVTGSDLKKRVVHIMTDRIIPKLNFTVKLLLWAGASTAVAVPVIYGLFHPTPGHAASENAVVPRYANVSIKRHVPEADGKSKQKVMFSLLDARFTAADVTPQSLIQLAYHVQGSELAGAPDWLNSAKYDIDARVDDTAAAQLNKLSEDQRSALGQQMLKDLLADQFKLRVHPEARDLPVYELTVGEAGSKLQKGGDHGFMHMGIGELTSNGTPLDLLAAQLSLRLGRTVVDKTGLTGNYAYSLRWTPDPDEQARLQASNEPVPPSGASAGSAPPLITAIQEQLGLSLQPQTDRVQVLVIDHIEPAPE